MKGFWNGFEKRALLSTKGSEIGLGSGVLGGLVPLGTTGHVLLGKRPEEHSRGMEWLKRIGGNVVGGLGGATVGGLGGGAAGAGLGALGGKAPQGAILGATIGAVLGNILGSIGGEAVGHNSAVGEYYDEKGKVKPKYKKHTD